MTAAPADLIGTSIVITGFLDPSPLQPATLYDAGLLSAEDTMAIHYDAVLSDLVNLRLPWLVLSVEPNRLSATTTLTHPAGEPVRDFVASLLPLMSRLRVSQVGINYECHFSVDSVERWHAIGDRLVPKVGIWDDILDDPGMLSMSVRSKKSMGSVGHMNVRVEPSVRLTPGLYVVVNNHFELADADPEIAINNISNILIDRWSETNRSSQAIINKIKGII